jgi:hypothetical protein
MCSTARTRAVDVRMMIGVRDRSWSWMLMHMKLCK